MMLATHFDYSPLSKVRKSLIAAAVFTLLFAAANFKSDTLLIFGLELEINQAAFVETLRMGIGALLLLFFLKAMQAFPRSWHRLIFLSDRKWEKKSSISIRETRAEIIDPNGYHPNEEYDDWDSWFYIELAKRTSRRQRLLEISNRLVATIGLSLDYLVPIVIGITVLENLYLLVEILHTKFLLSPIATPP